MSTCMQAMKSKRRGSLQHLLARLVTRRPPRRPGSLSRPTAMTPHPSFEFQGLAEHHHSFSMYSMKNWGPMDTRASKEKKSRDQSELHLLQISRRTATVLKAEWFGTAHVLAVVDGRIAPQTMAPHCCNSNDATERESSCER